MGKVTLPDGREFEQEELVALFEKLRADFPADQVEKLPKNLTKNSPRGKCAKGSRDNVSADGHYCGGYHGYAIHLDYIGHAGITDRLNSVDPFWNLDFAYHNADGSPVIDFQNGLAYYRLTILGHTRLCVGDAGGKQLTGNGHKEMFGDALRNGAMRFGVGTYLWSKSEEAARRKTGELADEISARENLSGKQDGNTMSVEDAYTQARATIERVTAEGVDSLRNLAQWAQAEGGWPADLIAEVNKRIAIASGTAKETN